MKTPEQVNSLIRKKLKKAAQHAAQNIAWSNDGAESTEWWTSTNQLVIGRRVNVREERERDNTITLPAEKGEIKGVNVPRTDGGNVGRDGRSKIGRTSQSLRGRELRKIKAQRLISLSRPLRDGIEHRRRSRG